MVPKPNMQPVFLSAKDFCAMKKSTIDIGKATCNPKSTLKDVIEKLATMKFHRVFVAQDSKVVGVITLGDVLKILTDHIKVHR